VLARAPPPLYTRAAPARHRRLLSQEAALKYFVLGAFASAFLLLGSAFLYGLSGSVSYTGVADALAVGGAIDVIDMDWLGLAGVVLAGLSAIVLMAARIVGRKQMIAMGPHLIVGAWLAWLLAVRAGS